MNKETRAYIDGANMAFKIIADGVLTMEQGKKFIKEQVTEWEEEQESNEDENVNFRGER